MTGRYVALGSSWAAGPGIRPRVPGSPRRAGRSLGNYPHLVAGMLGLALTDVTYSGATTADLLHDRQHGAPPQVAALDGTEQLVTITIGGNDVGYVPLLLAASLPRVVRRLPVLRAGLAAACDAGARDAALDAVGGSLRAVGAAVRARSGDARVVFVDYLTLLPPAGQPAAPLQDSDADLGRHVAARLAEITAEAAAATGCEVVRASAAGGDHHAWSAVPWTVGAALPLPGRPAPFHPNAAGMRAVAGLVVELFTPSG